MSADDDVTKTRKPLRVFDSRNRVAMPKGQELAGERYKFEFVEGVIVAERVDPDRDGEKHVRKVQTDGKVSLPNGIAERLDVGQRFWAEKEGGKYIFQPVKVEPVILDGGD